ncbi:MAG: hypothetical protein WBG92_07240 [Thiohalocapsa sp.]
MGSISKSTRSPRLPKWRASGPSTLKKTYQDIDLEVHARVGDGLYPDDEVGDAV